MMGEERFHDGADLQMERCVQFVSAVSVWSRSAYEAA
jgi:hypothetical protein